MQSDRSPWFVYGQEYFNVDAAVSAHVLEADKNGEFGYKLIFPNRELEFRGCLSLEEALDELRHLIGPVRKDVRVWEPNKLEKMRSVIAARLYRD